MPGGIASSGKANARIFFPQGYREVKRQELAPLKRGFVDDLTSQGATTAKLDTTREQPDDMEQVDGGELCVITVQRGLHRHKGMSTHDFKQSGVTGPRMPRTVLHRNPTRPLSPGC